MSAPSHPEIPTCAKCGVTYLLYPKPSGWICPPCKRKENKS